jgi:hypothetical protein
VNTHHLQKQREKEKPPFGGARTFALPGLLGCAAAFLSEKTGSVPVFASIDCSRPGIHPVSRKVASIPACTNVSP